MPATFPQDARDAWGGDLADQVEGWLEALVEERAVPRDEYREVLSRLDVLEERVEHVHGEVKEVKSALNENRSETKSALSEQRRETLELRREMNQRFDAVNERIDQLSAQFDQRLDSMSAQFDQRLDSMSAQFDQRLDSMNKQNNDRFDQLNERFDQMHDQMRTQTRWAIGILALFGTMTTVLMAIAVFSG